MPLVNSSSTFRLELAEVLGVRPGTVYSWMTRGVDIPRVKIEGMLRFIRKAREILSPSSYVHDHGGRGNEGMLSSDLDGRNILDMENNWC